MGPTMIWCTTTLLLALTGLSLGVVDAASSVVRHVDSCRRRRRVSGLRADGAWLECHPPDSNRFVLALAHTFECNRIPFMFRVHHRDNQRPQAVQMDVPMNLTLAASECILGCLSHRATDGQAFFHSGPSSPCCSLLCLLLGSGMLRSSFSSLEGLMRLVPDAGCGVHS